jgi:glycosyltransferase involved in cell wall biosynthesis
MLEVKRRVPAARCVIFGDGPERSRVRELVRRMELDDSVSVPGFVDASEIEAAWRDANCMVLPSRREGYGLVVVEAAQAGVPSVVVAEPDNAATELIDAGVNGFVAASDSPEDLATAITRCLEGGLKLRRSTADWYRFNAERLSLSSSLEQVAKAYASPSARR